MGCTSAANLVVHVQLDWHPNTSVWAAFEAAKCPQTVQIISRPLKCTNLFKEVGRFGLPTSRVNSGCYSSQSSA
jgi:hypothetical protein